MLTGRTRTRARHATSLQHSGLSDRSAPRIHHEQQDGQIVQHASGAQIRKQLSQTPRRKRRHATSCISARRPRARRLKCGICQEPQAGCWSLNARICRRDERGSVSALSVRRPAPTHGRDERAFPRMLNERPRYTTVAVASRSSRARRECPHDVLTVLRSGRLRGAGADCGHDDLRYFLGVGDHDHVRCPSITVAVAPLRS
jgi:hypothetical protein